MGRPATTRASPQHGTATARVTIPEAVRPVALVISSRTLDSVVEDAVAWTAPPKRRVSETAAVIGRRPPAGPWTYGRAATPPRRPPRPRARPRAGARGGGPPGRGR